MSSSLMFCLLVGMTTVVHYSCGQCTTKYCEEGEEGLNKNLMEQNQYLLQEISRIREITATQQQQYASLQEELKQVKSNQTEMQDEMNKTRSLTAFHVYMVKGYIYPNPGDVIPFNRVSTNIGGGFSTTTHKFRCPVSGVYAFWFTLFTGDLPYNGKRITAGELRMDGTWLSMAYCYNTGSNVVGMMCSNQAVTACQAGSTVWVRCAYSGVKLHGDAAPQTTFSGFLLREN